MVNIAAYGTWQSPITPALITAGQVGLSQPMLDRGTAYWLEARPQEAGRSVLVGRPLDGSAADLTPAPFSVRTRVHEYGGGAYLAADGVLLAVEFADQRVYRLGGGTPQPITPESERALRYADFALDRRRQRVLAVREDHRGGGEAVNSLVALPLAGGVDAGQVIAEGWDFCSSPRLSPDGRRLAWLSWDHPNMPWDGTSLWLADVAPDGTLGEPRRIAGGESESIVQPEWTPDGTLIYVSDRSGWWNLHRAEPGGGTPICPLAAEFAGPAWAFGSRWYGVLGPDSLLASYSQDGTSRLAILRIASGRLVSLNLPFTEYGGISVADGQAVLRVAAPDRPAAIIVLDMTSERYTELRAAGELSLDPAHLSRPEPVTFASEDGASAHAFYYPPAHPDVAAPAGSRPPLIVKSHGGPTGSASSELKLSNQFWTSRGFALVDVNYGGSTGYGRAYRERLRGRWGEVDVLDCINAARHLAAAGQADPERLAITGGSAGGYTTLCALTFHDVFKAGASHYGVSDLAALAKDTHKFESRYLDGLIGPYPAAAERYRARSPVHHVERLACPVIFFQGLEDAVVPPSQALMMVEALRAKGLPVAYLTFPGEQHGFRQAATIETVLRAELAFYGRIFGFTPADGLPELEIENLA